jgi:hypothetical protein
MWFIDHARTRRLFGPLYTPHFETNVRHRALSRKSIEAFGDQLMQGTFGPKPKKLRCVMGSGQTVHKIGKIRTDEVSVLLYSASNLRH